METGEYIKIQEGLGKRIISEDRIPGEIKTIAGVDQAFPGEDRVVSCVVVLNLPELSIVEKVYAEFETDFPYIPGLLAFREGPGIVGACRKLDKKPDVLMVDGHGIAHPRRVGIASHVGVLLDIATIGVAKRRLVGEFKNPEEVGGCNPLKYQGDMVGAVLKSKRGCNPIYVSPGNRISLETSIALVRKCLRGYKLPEPTRLAHELVNEQIR